MNKNKNINIKPYKGISIVIKNDFQPEIKQKKKRKYKKKVNTDILKMPTVPSFIPQGDVSYIKPQYNMSSLNRNVIFPGVPQSLPPPPQLAQLMPPPTQQPTNANFENMLSSFGNMIMNSLMPIESGFKSKSYIVELDDDIMDALPAAEKDKYIENKIKPQIEKEIQDISFPDEAKKAEFMNNAISIKTSKEYGTKHANKLIPFDPKYNGNEYYKANYISRLQEIINQDAIKTRAGIKENTQENKNKARELLKSIGVQLKPALNVVVPEYKAPPIEEEIKPVMMSPARPPKKAIFSPPPANPPIEEPTPVAAAKPPPPPTTAAAAPPPPPPPPAAATAKPKSNSIDDKKLIELGAIPLSDGMKEVMKTEPKIPAHAAGWSIGLVENDDLLDYLQDVINKISEDDDFMNDLEKSKGSGKIKFYKKYLQVSALFKYNNVNTIKKEAWKMFLETNDKLKTDFENEPEPVKEIKKVDEEKLNKLSEMAKAKGKGAKYDEENKKKEEEKKRKEMEASLKQKEEEDRIAEEEKRKKAEARKNKGKK